MLTYADKVLPQILMRACTSHIWSLVWNGSGYVGELCNCSQLSHAEMPVSIALDQRFDKRDTRRVAAYQSLAPTFASHCGVF